MDAVYGCRPSFWWRRQFHLDSIVRTNNISTKSEIHNVGSHGDHIMEDKFAGFIARWLAHSATPKRPNFGCSRRKYCSAQILQFGLQDLLTLCCGKRFARGRRIFTQMTFNWLVDVLSSVGFTLDREPNVASRRHSQGRVAIDCAEHFSVQNTTLMVVSFGLQA